MNDHSEPTEIETILWSMSKNLGVNLATGALGLVPVGGFALSAALQTIMGALDNTIQDLKQELREEIYGAIAKSDKADYENDVDGAARLFWNYSKKIEGGISDVADLKTINQQLIQLDGQVLGATQMDPIDRIPLLFAYTTIRTAVWEQIFKNDPVALKVPVDNQIKKYVVEAGALMERLIINASIQSAHSIILVPTNVQPGSQPNAFRPRTDNTFEFKDGGQPLASYPPGTANIRQKFDNFVHQWQVDKLNDLTARFMEPIRDLGRKFGAYPQRISRGDMGGSAVLLIDQYIDVFEVKCEAEWFAATVGLYKHHNNLAIEIDARKVAVGQSKTVEGAGYKTFDNPQRHAKKPGATGNLPLGKLHADYRPVFCEPGQAMAGIKLRELIISGKECFGLMLWSRPIDGGEGKWVGPHGPVSYSQGTMVDQFANYTGHVRQSKEEIVVGCCFVKIGNQLHLEVIYGTIEGVRAELDYKNGFVP